MQTSRCGVDLCLLSQPLGGLGRKEAFQEFEDSLCYIVSSNLSYTMPQKRKSPQNNQPLHQTSFLNNKKLHLSPGALQRPPLLHGTSFTISHTWLSLCVRSWILPCRKKIGAGSLSIWSSSSGNKSGTWRGCPL